MRRTPTGLVSGISRIIAAAFLVGTLVVLPVLVWRSIGGAGSSAGGIDWRTVLRSGRIDADTVVALGLVVFTALWAWFALTAVAEVTRVVAWRRHPMATLPPVPPSPSGAIRRLVRAALVSTSTVVGAGLVSLAGVNGVGAAAPAMFTTAPSSVASTTMITQDRSAVAATRAPAVLRSTGRDTPYSVALRLGDPILRDQIIDLNRGAIGPDGSAWSGGVFPAGMAVALPEGLLEGRLGEEQITWVPYRVDEGDSVYRIATRLADGDNRRVRDLADAIIERNLGRIMVDGSVFDDPSLVRIGWSLDVPSSSGSAVAEPQSSWDATHVVDAGESYWSIAEQHLAPSGEAAAAADVAELMDALIEHNAPLLGHDQRAMLHPGDPVELPAQSPVDTRIVDVPTGPTIDDPAIDDPAIDDPAIDAADRLPEVIVSAAPSDHDAHTQRLEDSLPEGPAPVLELPGGPRASNGFDAVSASATPDAATDSGGGPDQHDASVQAGRSPVTTSLAAAVLLCAGALGLVESRRRQQLRRAGADALLAAPTAREVQIERLVRSLDATQRAVRLDLALRAAGHALVGTGGYVLATTVGDDGGVTLILDRPARVPSAPWQQGIVADRWALPAAVTNEELAPMSRLAGQPCPAVVHLGRLVADTADPAGADGELFVDLEAFGLVCIDADVDGSTVGADAIVRAIATSLAASPVGETLRLITHDLDPAVHLGNFNAERAGDFDTALDLAASALGSTPMAIGHRRTAELRSRGVGGEAWEPVVIVSASEHHEPGVLRELLDVTRGGGRGLAVVLRHAVEGASLTVRAGRGGWEIERLGLTVVPVGLDVSHVADLHQLLAAAEQPVLEIHAPSHRAVPADPLVEPAWMLMVRVLGSIDVVDRCGATVEFDRGKSLELVAWLAQHRAGSTRGGARAALWDLDVRDATFANVVSDARRSLGRAVEAADNEEWIARTLTDQLPLHAQVMSDAEVLHFRLEASRGRAAHEAIDVLRPGVALIRGMPFAGTDFLWPDAEGITSALTLLATTAATELARHHLSVGDVDGVFWATGQGLRALPGHEELIGLRMRAHAQGGDLAGVRREWEGYERAITADLWSDGEPSPKLLALRRELLSA